MKGLLFGLTLGVACSAACKYYYKAGFKKGLEYSKEIIDQEFESLKKWFDSKTTENES